MKKCGESNTEPSFKVFWIGNWFGNKRNMEKHEKIVLTDLEFRLLLFLAKSPGRVFSYQQIYEADMERMKVLYYDSFTTHDSIGVRMEL